MSIPRRLWRVVRGHWNQARSPTRSAPSESVAEAARDVLADAAALREIEETLASSAATEGTMVPSSVPSARPKAAPPRPLVDPLAADLALLGAPPASDLETLDRSYQARLSEIAAEEQAGTATDITARRAALTDAYERVRDAINTTETRFEKLEF